MKILKLAKRLSPTSLLTRGALAAVAALDVGLRTRALADLAKRPQEQVKGPKAVWAVALSAVSTAGLLPAAYLWWGRTDD